MTEIEYPPDEEERVEALTRLGLLDIEPEERFDRVCRLAATTFDVPVAYISLMSEDRQVYMSSVGLGELTETPRSVAICNHTVCLGSTVLATDCSCDPRFQDNPFVSGPPGVRFYLGQALLTRDGYTVGTFCLIDLETREVDEKFLQQFQEFAKIAENELNLVDLVGAQRSLLALKNEVAPSLNLSATLERMVEGLQSTVDFERLAVVLRNEDSWSVAASTEERVESINPLPELPGRGDGECPLRCFPPGGAALRWWSWPILKEKTLLGYVVVEGDTERPLGTLQEEILSGFAAQIAETIENLRVANELVESEKMAAVGSLASGVAHELNSPLGAVILNLDSAIKKLEGTDVQGRLVRAVESACRAKVIIETLLMFAQKKRKVASEVEMATLIEDSLEPLKVECIDKKIELSLDLAANGRLNADAGQIRQLICELTRNAISALENLEPPRSITIRSLSCEGQFCLLVEDNGEGIPEDSLARVFDPFFTTKPVGSGMGLGLSVCHRIVTELEGTIQLQSVGRGTTVSIGLPITAESLPQSSPLVNFQ